MTWSVSDVSTCVCGAHLLYQHGEDGFTVGDMLVCPKPSCQRLARLTDADELVHGPPMDPELHADILRARRLAERDASQSSAAQPTASRAGSDQWHTCIAILAFLGLRWAISDLKHCVCGARLLCAADENGWQPDGIVSVCSSASCRLLVWLPKGDEKPPERAFEGEHAELLRLAASEAPCPS